MTGLQIAMAAGACITLGLVLLIWRLLPADPDLASALDRLAPLTTRARQDRRQDPQIEDRRERIGRWAQTQLPSLGWGRVGDAELAILGSTRSRLSGEMMLAAVAGLCLPTLLVALLRLLGITLPIAVPALASLILAAGLFLLPVKLAKERATAAREEFRRALGAYIDLVALERRNGSGTWQALTRAAEVGDSWVFTRVQQELQRSAWMGESPWDGLAVLAADLHVPELDELANIMRTAGEAGAVTYTSLRARGTALRTAMLTDELGRANAASERLRLPTLVMVLLFVLMLVIAASMNAFL